MPKQITDQYHGDPTYAELHVLSRSRPLVRQMLKTASFSEGSVEHLPSSAFAWEDERRFPVHTEADTVASILYRSKLGSAVPEHVDAKLSQAAEIYQLPDVLFAGEKTAAAPEVEYALPAFTKTASDGEAVDHSASRLPLDNELGIKLAEDVLCRDFQKLTLETRADAFSRLTKAAQFHDIGLRPLTQKLAGLTVTDTTKLCEWIEARAAATEGPIRSAFDKIASSLKGVDDITDRKDQIKLASAIAELDKKAGLERHYDRKLPDPLLTVFNTEKVAEDSCDVAGKKVACSILMGLPDNIWEDVDMPEMSKIADGGDAEEFKQAFDTIPRDIKVVLRSYV